MIKTGAATKRLNILKEATSRDFKGGLDVADSELNLTSRFARELNNMVIGIDGSLQIRQGCRLFADIAPLTSSYIMNYRYFSGKIVVVDHAGQLFTVDGQGSVTRIWDADIAAAKRPGLTKWGSAEFVTFEEVSGNLIIGSGVDKPLNVTSAFVVDYLADLGTGSNINVPVSAVLAKFARHTVWANGSIITVSERDAAGTYPGDPGVVYAGTFDLATYVTVGDPTIIGMIPFKNFLMVMFRECVVPVQFTEIAATDTVPAALQINVSPDSVITNYGTVAPRTLQDIGEYALSLDIVGVADFSLATFTKILSPDRPSRLVDPLLQKAINPLNTTLLHDHTFAIYDRKLSTYMLMIPDRGFEFNKLTSGFGYHYIDSLKIEAWNRYSGWNWQCATRSSEGRVFFSRGFDTQIFVIGDQINDPIYADFVGEQETFSDGTIFTDGTGWTPIADANSSGLPIQFAWELPWTDLRHQSLTKTLRYAILSTEGSATFTVKAFIDDRYLSKNLGETFSDGTLFTDDTGWIPFVDPPYIPALTWNLVGRDQGGYGVEAYGSDPYGGGNNAASRKLTLTPTKFTTLKLRFEGESMKPLKFAAITLLYQVGTVRRLPYGQ